jgi:murein DD-endopeptidase MepM/ murein hydrolase activator NlpD
MTDEKEKKRELMKRLRLRYRLVVMNDDTFEEKISLSLTPLSVFVMVGSTIIVMIILVISLIAFTPLREYIPGYADVGIWRKMIDISHRSDSLEQEIIARNEYLVNLGDVLKGKIDADAVNYNKPDTTTKYKNLDIGASSSEVKLREELEVTQDQYGLEDESKIKKGEISNYFFFTPVKGIVSNSFNANEKHFGVDVVGKENELVKSTMDGTVILATWSSETGHTITVQHTNHIISVYKHNSMLLRKVGNAVKAGDPIAVIGNSGEHTTGPHLHFELWYNGTPIDPQDYISFK